MLLDRLISALVVSKNEAADDVLLEAIDHGNLKEQTICLEALLKRAKQRGLSGVVARFEKLPETLQRVVLANMRTLYHAMRECGRSDDVDLRVAALKLIALGRQGKLAYVLSENLHDTNEVLNKAAVDAMVELSLWISQSTRWLSTNNAAQNWSAEGKSDEVHRTILDQRPEIEMAVARAIDLHRGRFVPELLRATLLLADWPGSKTLAILHTTKHGGQSPMVRRLQQAPQAEHVEAFLLGASNGGLRSHFGAIFSHIDEPETLDRLLEKTHWLKDHQLQLCLHQVTRGTWFDPASLRQDLERRKAPAARLIGDWITSSGLDTEVQDKHLAALYEHAAGDVGTKLHLLRLATARRRGVSVDFVRSLLADPDERVMRMAAREIIRRRPPDMENLLLKLMSNAPESVRRVVGRAIGQVGFENYWERFDRLDRATRKQAGKGMLKILPDANHRLSRKLSSGPIEQRVKAMQMTHELGLTETLKDVLLQLVQHPSPRVRSKAIALVGALPNVEFGVLLEKALTDQDSRVRANAIEVLESQNKSQYVPLLTHRARSSHNRERANAIKALHHMRVGTAGVQLTQMLKDERSEHRISALWALRQIGFWQMMNEVVKLAKSDTNLKVRRYALGVLRNVAETVEANKLAGKTG